MAYAARIMRRTSLNEMIFAARSRKEIGKKVVTIQLPKPLQIEEFPHHVSTRINRPFYHSDLQQILGE
jgi:hypothetical protein